MTNVESGIVYANQSGVGNVTVSIPAIPCSESGIYQLATGNSIGDDVAYTFINVIGIYTFIADKKGTFLGKN